MESNIINILKNNSTMNEEKPCNSNNPFSTVNTNLNFKAGNIIPTFKNNLNLSNEIKLLYKIIGNPNMEINIFNWTIISFNKSLYLFNQKKCKDYYDIAFKINKNNKINVLSYDITNNKLIYRENNSYKFVNFVDWFYNLDK